MSEMIAGGKLMSPRKAMASAGGGSFGCGKIPGSEGGGATHVSPATGRLGELADSARATSPAVKGSGAFGRQAAPSHGPMSTHHSY